MHQDFSYAANPVPNPTLDLFDQIVTFLNSHFGINEDMEIHPYHAAHSARTDPMTALNSIDAARCAGDALDICNRSIAEHLRCSADNAPGSTRNKRRYDDRHHGIQPQQPDSRCDKAGNN